MVYPTPRAEEAAWARAALQQKTLFLDVETTGLGKEAEIIQVGLAWSAPLLDEQGDRIEHADGGVLIDTLVRPTGPIAPSATRVHGITGEMVADAPRFSEIYPLLTRHLIGQTIYIYNAPFDVRMLTQACAAHLLPQLDFTPVDVMWPFSKWVGDKTERGRVKKQRLPGATHGAIGDCRATLRVLMRMAGLLGQGRRLAPKCYRCRRSAGDWNEPDRHGRRWTIRLRRRSAHRISDQARGPGRFGYETGWTCQFCASQPTPQPAT